MSNREWLFFIKDISISIKRIEDYIQGMAKQEFLEDQKTFDAVMRNLEIIGEASNHIPINIQVKYNQLDWRKMTSIRNLVIHEYFGIDNDIIWDTIQNKLDDIKFYIDLIINENDKT